MIIKKPEELLETIKWCYGDTISEEEAIAIRDSYYKLIKETYKKMVDTKMSYQLVKLFLKELENNFLKAIPTQIKKDFYQ